jgi:hypothetical protein
MKRKTRSVGTKRKKGNRAADGNGIRNMGKRNQRPMGMGMKSFKRALTSNL